VVAVAVVAMMPRMTGVHVVTGTRASVIVVAAVFTAGVTNLNLADKVMLLVALALVRRAVAFAARVVVAHTHQPGIAFV
jgi:hypothetical protein